MQNRWLAEFKDLQAKQEEEGKQQVVIESRQEQEGHAGGVRSSRAASRQQAMTASQSTTQLHETSSGQSTALDKA